MGHHYVPRQHLRRFAINDGDPYVWMYDKVSRKFCKAGIANVAQESGYYEPEVESALAETVEGPGKIVIDKLLMREKIDDAERDTLSLFFMLMMTRGPRRRAKLFKWYPELLEKSISKIKADICQLATDESDSHMAQLRMEELERVGAKFATEMPQGIRVQIRRPFYSKRTVECIRNMYWHVIPAPAGTCFITSDTPAHCFEHLGVGTLESEFTITLSKSVALIGENRRNLGVGYEKPKAHLTKEINRRILSHAKRFVFSSQQENWIDIVSQKSGQYLSLIRW